MKDFSYITIPEAWFLQLHHALNANPLNPMVDVIAANLAAIVARAEITVAAHVKRHAIKQYASTVLVLDAFGITAQFDPWDDEVFILLKPGERKRVASKPSVFERRAVAA